MTFLLTASPDDSPSAVDSVPSFAFIVSSDDVPLSPDPLEGMSEDLLDSVDCEVSVVSDDSSSSGLNILGMSLRLEFSEMVQKTYIISTSSF